MARFTDIFLDITKEGRKIPKENYLQTGTYPIIDQGQEYIAGFSNESNGLFKDVPAIIFGDHTRIIKYIDMPCFLGADGVKLLKAKDSNANYKYLYYALKHARIPNTGYNRHFKWLKELEIRLPSNDEQQKVVVVLDKLSNLIFLRKQQLAKLDELVKARFVEVFGDPVQNPLEWITKSLLELGDCKNGMNYHIEDFGVDIHCLGVGDFKDLSTISETDKLPIISLKEMPSNEYMLQDGDIVFVRSNGNKALVGRSLIVYPNKIPTTFSGFCIRFRLNCDSVLPIYLLMVLKTDSIRKKMAGRGANIQNLNQKILSELIIPIPPLSHQQDFSKFFGQVSQQKLTIQQSLDKLEVLKKTLMQEYFG